MADISYDPEGNPLNAIMVSPTVGRAALGLGAVIAGMPGFGSGPVYTCASSRTVWFGT